MLLTQLLFDQEEKGETSSSSIPVPLLALIAQFLTVREGFSVLRVLSRQLWMGHSEEVLVGLLMAAYRAPSSPSVIARYFAVGHHQTTGTDTGQKGHHQNHRLELFRRLLSPNGGPWAHLSCRGCFLSPIIGKRFYCLHCGANLCPSCGAVHPNTHVLCVSNGQEDLSFEANNTLLPSIVPKKLPHCQACGRGDLDVFHFSRRGPIAPLDAVVCMPCYTPPPLQDGDTESCWGPLRAKLDKVTMTASESVERSVFCDYCGILMTGEYYKSMGVIDFDLCPGCFAEHEIYAYSSLAKHKGWIVIREYNNFSTFKIVERLQRAETESAFFRGRRRTAMGDGATRGQWMNPGGEFTDPTDIDLPPHLLPLTEVTVYPPPSGRLLKAQSLETGTLCAVKVLTHPHSNSSTTASSGGLSVPVPSSSERERDESRRKLSNLKMNHLLPYKEIGDIADSRLSYTVAPWCAGGSIEQVMVHSAKLYLQPSAIRQFARAVLLGLENLHAQGLVHGNLHPNNVLQDHSGQILLSDYRLVFDALGCAPSPADGINFFAPEVLHGEAATVKSDLWTFGAMLLFLMTSRRRWVELDVRHPEEVERYVLSLSSEELVPPVVRNWRQGTCVEAPFGFEKKFYEVLEAVLRVDPSTRLSASALLDFPLFTNASVGS